MGALFWTLVIPALLVIGALVLFVKARSVADVWDMETTLVPRLIATLVVVLGLAIVTFNSFTVVPPRNVGVLVEFGKADKSLENGWHMVAPWSSVENIDGTVQTQLMTVTVRLANQTTAQVDTVVQWNVDPKSNANTLWQRYRGRNDDVIKNIHDNVVWRQTTVALNSVFASYNPLVVLTGGTENRSQADLAKQAEAMLKSSVDPGIVIDTLAISLVHFDPVTQDKLNGYAQALADTQIATQQKLTAEQQRLANEKLAVGSSSDPGVKYQNCLNLIKDLAAKLQLQNLQYGGLMCSTGDNSIIVGK